MKKRKGAALPLVLIAFMVTSVLMVVMFNHATANIRLSVRQQEFTRAYYYTLAGMELGTAALYTTKPGDTTTLFDDFNNQVASVDTVDAEHPLVDVITFARNPDADLGSDNPKAAEVKTEIYGVNEGTVTDPEIWVILDVTTELFDGMGNQVIATHGERKRFLAANPAKYEHTRRLS